MAVLLAAPLVAASAARYDWSAADLAWLTDAKYRTEAEPSRAACARVIGAEPPAADRPTPAQAAALKGCDSEALLFGIGRLADPAAARKCAILERDRGTDTNLAYFRGPGILAVAYANGLGGARDLDVATHMACGVDDAVAATEGRIADLQARRAQRGAKPFGMCDAATSGASGAVCADHEARLADRRRAAAIAVLERGWPPARRAAFDRAYASLQDYARIAHDMDCFRGTGQAACTIEGVERDKTHFLAKVGAMLGRNPPPRVPRIGSRQNAATAPEQWQALVADAGAEERPWYVENGRKTIAARARFERDLLAFAATVPDATPHATRALFADL